MEKRRKDMEVGGIEKKKECVELRLDGKRSGDEKNGDERRVEEMIGEVNRDGAELLEMKIIIGVTSER